MTATDSNRVAFVNAEVIDHATGERVTDSKRVEDAYGAWKPEGEAWCTCRRQQVLDSADLIEWAQSGWLDGRQATVYWMSEDEPNWGSDLLCSLDRIEIDASDSNE